MSPFILQFPTCSGDSETGNISGHSAAACTRGLISATVMSALTTHFVAAETVELATPVDIPQQPAPGASSLLGADLKPAQLKPGVFSRAAHMREVAKQQLANVPGGARYPISSSKAVRTSSKAVFLPMQHTQRFLLNATMRWTNVEAPV